MFFSVWSQLLDRPQQLLVIVLIPITSFVAQSELISSGALLPVGRPHMGHASIEGVPSIPTSSSYSLHGLGGDGDQRFKTSPQPPLQVIYTCRSETWITVIEICSFRINCS